jgi:hypothetical protein
MGVIHSANAHQLLSIESQTEYGINDIRPGDSSEDLSFDVEIDTQPLQDFTKFEESVPPQISPLVVNNASTNRKTIQSEQDALVINIDLEKQTIPSGDPLYYSIQGTRGLNPAVGTVLLLEIIDGEYWGYGLL